MREDERLEQYLQLCYRIYLRMEKNGEFPWDIRDDSTDYKDVVESESL